MRAPLIAPFAVFALLATDTVFAQVTVIEIPALVEGQHCSARDINESGEVLVLCGTPGVKDTVQFVWTISDASVTRVGDTGWCSHINDAGQVLCNSNRFVDASVVLWSRETGAVVLDGYLWGYALNDVGDTLLSRRDGAVGVRRSDGTFVPIPAKSFAASLNNLAQVPILADGAWSLWTPDRAPVALPHPSPFAEIYVQDVNDAGQVLADGRQDPSLPVVALRFDPASGWVKLATPAHLESGSMFSSRLNSLGHAAGVVAAPEGKPWYSRAVYWSAPDMPVDLGDYAGANTWAYGINAAGQVVGSAYCDAGECVERALVWNPVPPEPPTPIELIEAVDEQINALLDTGAISGGEAESLGVKLDAAGQAIERGNPQAARNVLTAAANQVNALRRSRRISEADAETLLAAIAEAMAGL